MILVFLFLLLSYAPYTITTPTEHLSFGTSEGHTLSFDQQSSMTVSISIPSDKLVYPNSVNDIKNGDTIIVCKDTDVTFSVSGTTSLSNVEAFVITDYDTIDNGCSSYSGSGSYSSSWTDYQICMYVKYGRGSSPQYGYDIGGLETRGDPTITIGSSTYGGTSATKTITISSPQIVSISYYVKSAEVGIYYPWPLSSSTVGVGWDVGDTAAATSSLSFEVVDPGSISLTTTISPTTVTITTVPTTVSIQVTNTGPLPIVITDVTSSHVDISVNSPDINTIINPGETKNITIEVDSTATSSLSTVITIHYRSQDEVCGNYLTSSNYFTLTYNPAPTPLPDLVPEATLDSTNYPNLILKTKIRNTGSGNAIGVWVSVENVSDANSPGKDNYFIGDLVAGDSYDLDLNYKCENGDEVYHVIISVDPDNQVVESIENNNVFETTIYCSLQCEFNPASLTFDDNTTKTATLTCDGANCEDVTWDPLTKFSISFTNPTFSITPTDTGTFTETLKVKAQKDGQIYNCDLPLSSNIEEGMSECRKRI